ncbi:MAG TPA: hypothetical protein VGP10_02355, partial [Marisediminicola sp.]|nr:hypothetical protein [Marisediminicola sp.]
MIARSLRLLIAVTWIVATFLAFIVVSARNDGAPLPATATITVRTWTGSSTLEDLRSAMEQYARHEQITFAQEIADFGNRGAVRHLYLADGDPQVPGATWLADGMGDFGGSRSTVVHPLRDLGTRSPLGAYDVFGDYGKAEELRTFLASRGMSVDLVELGRVGFVPRPVLLTVAVVALLIISMVGTFVVAGTRRYAVGRLHGLSYGSLLMIDLRRFAPTWAISGLAVLSLAGLVVLLRYGSPGIGLFLVTAGAIQLVLLLAAAAAHTLVLAMVVSVEMSPALKGELPARALTFTAYGLRLTAVVIALGTIATTLTLTADITARDRSRAAFERLGKTSTITLGNAYTIEDQNKLDETVGPWLRKVDREHDLLLSAQQVIGSSDPRWRGVHTLIVNDKFLAAQPVRLAGGGRVGAADPDHITVMIPDTRWDARTQLRSQLGLAAQLRPRTNIDYEWVRAAPDQRFFTYAPASGSSESEQVWNTTTTFVTDPVIVVMPSGRGWLSDGSYSAFASQGGALFGDPRIVGTAVRQEPRLERFVRGATPVADKAAAALTEQTALLRMSLFTAIISCFVVAMTGVAAALIHTRQMAQRIFVRHMSGWPFATIYRAILIFELTLLAGLLAWIPWRVAAQRRALEGWQATGAPLPVDLPSVSPEQWAAIAALALVTSGGFLLSLVAA